MKQKVELSLFTKVLLASVLSYTIVGLDVGLFSNILANNQTLSPVAAVTVAIPLFFMFATLSIYITIRAFRIGDNKLALLYSIFWPLLLFLLPFVLFSTLLIILMVASIMLFYELLFIHIHKEPGEHENIHHTASHAVHARAIHRR